MKHVIVSVINDLVTDQRVHKSCLTLQKAGFEVLLVGRKLKNSPKMDDRPYRTHRMRLIFEKGPLFYAEYNIRLFLYLLFHKADCLLSNDLDTLLPSFFISRMKRINLIYDSHEYFTEVPELVYRPKVQKVWRTIEEFVLPKMKEMITVNESIADLFRDKYGIKVHVIRNIPMRKMKPAPTTREALGLPNDKHILILQGSGINIHRGSEELVSAMQYLDDCVLLIIGGGDVLPLLKKEVTDNHYEDRVRFFPRMPYQDMMAITQLAELGFTLDRDTNLNYKFSLPNKLFDYIQADVPIIASHLPEIERIIRNYNIGAFIDDHDPLTIARTIKDVISDEKTLLTWKNNLTFAAKDLCWENEENILMKIYEQYI
ncbi:MAG: glycosyltransferase family 4 protein [Lentimicrobiaceae bacterium]|nr:glycosyltransferase family 4 protein [Lentimicrobiaceae bacterium]